MYSSYPHIARSFDLKELTVLFDDWEQSGKVICGKIRYQRKTDDCSHEVAFKLLTEELDQNGFPKLQVFLVVFFYWVVGAMIFFGSG